MYKLILVFGICSVFALSNSQPVSKKTSQKIIGCYLEFTSMYEDSKEKFGISKFNTSLCTHILYSSTLAYQNGTFTIALPLKQAVNNKLKKFSDLQKQNGLAKSLIAVEALTDNLDNHSKVVTDPNMRKRLVTGLVDLVKYYKMNGLCVQWESIVQRDGIPEDKKNIILLLKDLRSSFNKYGFILCFSTSVSEKAAKMSYDIKEISKYVDIIQISVLLHSSTDKALGHPAPLNPSSKESPEDKKLNIDHIVKYWTAEGAAPGKIVVAISLDGNSFILKNPGKISRGAPLTGPGKPEELEYNKICRSIKDKKWEVVYDREQNVPYAHKGNQVVAYENVQSLTAKAEYIKKIGLAGITLYDVDSDDIDAHCGKKYVLLTTINQVLKSQK